MTDNSANVQYFWVCNFKQQFKIFIDGNSLNKYEWLTTITTITHKELI